jgi:hypothetical protein
LAHVEHGNPQIAAAYVREAIRRMEILEARDPTFAKERHLAVQPRAAGE